VTVLLEPSDQAARELIRTGLDQTLFVEAGAGTGKTTALVRRVGELVVTGRVTQPRELAAITFTEAAAAELRDRVREELEADAQRLDLTDDERGRVRAFLADIDEVTVTTLHGFASRLLGEFPLEAGLPPGFEVEDEIEASVRFDRRWDDLVDDLHADPWLQVVLARGLALRLPLHRLREVADAFDDNWDRLGSARGPDGLPPVDVAPVLDGLDAALRQAPECCDPGDKLLDHLTHLVAPVRRELVLLAELDDPDALLTSLVRSERLSCTLGTKDAWGDAKAGVADALAAAEEARLELIHDQRQAVVEVLADRIRTFALEGAEGRRRRGQVSYHDLLVRARDLLRNDAGVRTALAGRYRHLLIDEFQDTDPLQIEIAALLAGAHPDAQPGDWDEIEVVPGKLFFVGDPKQSIYRFRRADIALYARAHQAFAAEVVRLVENFRSVPDVLSWVNQVFGEIIADDGDAQPAYVDLAPHRADHDGPPAVIVIGGPTEEGSIGDLREAEATELAALVRRMRAERWMVGREQRAPLRYDDVALLVPTRTPLAQIERALEAEGIPYRIESRSLIFRTDEVRELLAILAAVDDPADQVALVTALRSPGLACSDADLATWRLAGGAWDVRLLPPEGLEDHPVARAFAHLVQLHEARDWLPVSDLVARVVRERRLVELTLARRRPRDHWRRYRFLTDAARAFVEVGGTSLAEFVAWVSAQAEGGADRIETVVREADDDAVRIMTVHGSKGLEFPVVVLAGLNAERDNRHPVVAWGAAGPEVRFGSAGQGYWETAGYEAVRQADKRFDEAEQRRLLYVAATRAQDHLVVSLHHRAGKPSHAALLHERCDACPGLSAQLAEAEQLVLDPDTAPSGAPVEPDDAADRWAEARAALLDRLRASGVVTPSGLSHDVTVPRAEEDQRVPGRGEGGTARGRAVHAVLQSVTLPDAADLDSLAGLHAAEEGLVGREAEVAALARSVLATEVLRRAAAAPRCWRELAVVTEVDGRLVEGFVDLVFERDDGRLVVVDYKTDLDVAPDRYRPQVAAYALAVARATGREVVEGWLVFAHPDGAVEHQLTDLPAAVAGVEALLRSGS
jgi:ATP-dependent exoDNAse (exonuclease V) beta subunit